MSEVKTQINIKSTQAPVTKEEFLKNTIYMFIIKEYSKKFYLLKPNTKIRMYSQKQMEKNIAEINREKWSLNYNVGIDLHNLIVLDFDILSGEIGIEKGKEIKENFYENHLKNNALTLIIETPHGFHVYYKKTEDMKKYQRMIKPFKDLDGIDDFLKKMDYLTGDNEKEYYVVSSGSIVEGREYNRKTSINFITNWGEDNLSKEVTTLLGEIELQKEIEKEGSIEKPAGRKNEVRGENETSKVLFNSYEIEPIKEGERNETITSITGFILSYEKDKARGRELVHQINNTFCKPSLTENEVNSIFNSILKREERQVRNREYYEVKLNENIIEVYFEGNEKITEQEIAELFYNEKMQGNLFATDPAENKIFLYKYIPNDGIYLPYGYSEFNYDFHSFYSQIKSDGKILSKNALEKNYSYIHSIAMEKEKIVSRYNADPRRYAIFNIIVKEDNQDPVFLGYKSKFKILQNFNERDFLEKSEIINFLKNFCKDQTVIDREKVETETDEKYIWFLTYILSAVFNMQRDRAETLYIQGEGSNGKTTVFNIFKEIFEPYVGTLPYNFFDPYKKMNSEYYLSQLEKLRLAIVPEIPEKIDEGLLKSIAGETDIPSREVYEKVKITKNNASLVLVSNNMPSIKTFTKGTLRRFLIFHVNFEINDKDKVPNIVEKMLEKEGDSFYTYLVNFAKTLMEKGEGDQTIGSNILKNKPDCILKETKNYFCEIDPLGEFLEDNIEVTDNPNDFVSNDKIYARYKEYCTLNGIEKIPSKQSFLKVFKLGKKGIHKSGLTTVRIRSGIRFK